MEAESAANRVGLICTKLSTYFGGEYEISSNNVDVVMVKSGLKSSVYVESEDIMIVDSCARDHGLTVAKWRILVANGQVGLYCVLGTIEETDGSPDLMERRLTTGNLSI